MSDFRQPNTGTTTITIGPPKPDSGGPAFPCPEQRAGEIGIRQAWDGMSLRDWFAGQAMVGMLTDGYNEDSTHLATDAYDVADRMLAERAKVHGSPE